MKPPCLIFEDDHLLVVNKPAGLNTHAPSPYSGEGLFDWLRHREPRWANLAIIHRLDKETSGLILFSKTTLANRSLAEQFTGRTVRKTYLLLTDRAVPESKVVKTALVRVGDKYVSRPIAAGAEVAETRFSLLKRAGTHDLGPGTLVQAQPITGRTHQIRVHAAETGFAILGDTRYGGTPAQRVCLHAAELCFRHPLSGEELAFKAPADFQTDPPLALRRAVIHPQSSTAFRLINGASDNFAGCYVDILGPYLLSQSAGQLSEAQKGRLEEWAQSFSAQGVYHKLLATDPRATDPRQLSPKLVLGSAAPERFTVLENGLQFELSFAEGYSVGLFIDQRDNRRRLLSGHVAAGFPLFEQDRQNVGQAFLPAGARGFLAPGQSFNVRPTARDWKVAAPADRNVCPTKTGKPQVLNTFSYTCGFSVCAAEAGFRTTSLDLSRKYLDWGKRNFAANQIDPAEHDFLFGDVFGWLRRLGKKGREFDVILLDPPTFSRSKEFGPFRVEKDYSRLVAAALPLLRPRGVLFAASNAATFTPEAFLEAAKHPIVKANRTILQEQYFPQPPDFPVSRGEPAYLKTVWMRVQ